ncbi:MAG: outer membrane beta-barrel protein [Prevotella sp.]|nr:outer membrane beta-barrel protein [Prevotella sp.]
MKKIFMTLAAVAVAATMNAQIYVGGSLGFNSSKTTNEVSMDGVTASTDQSSTQFTFSPEVGYKLNDNMAVGLALGFGTGSKDAVIEDYDGTIKNTSFTIQPYFRYTFVKWDKVSLFADAELGYTTGKDTYEISEDNVTVSTDVKSNAFHFAIVPGIAYQASEKISVVAKLGAGLGYWYTKQEPTDEVSISTSEFGLNLNSLGLSLGVYYNF